MTEPNVSEGYGPAALLYCGESLWRAALVNTPFSHTIYEWMNHLVVGCTAIEVTTARDTDDDARIGIIQELPHDVWIPYTEHEGGYTEKQTLVLTADGRQLSWTNCHWVRIPVTRDEWREATNGQSHTAESQGSGGTL